MGVLAAQQGPAPRAHHDTFSPKDDREVLKADEPAKGPEPIDKDEGAEENKEPIGPPGKETPVESQPAKLAGPDPPVAVVFDDKGIFTMQTTLDANHLDTATKGRTRRCFRFRAQANVACVVVESPQREISVRVEPADGGVAIEPKDKAGPRNQLAFLPEKDAEFIAVATGEGLKPFTMTIRLWDESEPLPASLRFPAPPLARPKVALIEEIKDKLLVGAAFALDNKLFWTSHHDMTLTLWQYPTLKKKGTYKLKERLYALAVDGKGRLYAQPGPADTANPLFARRSVGNLVVYADLHPKGDADELPRPLGRILVDGLVGRMICSKDGRSIFFLDVQNGKVGRIDAENIAVNGSVDNLSEGVTAFCLTPDGKKIYCCATTGQIDVIDVASFKLEHTVALDRGRPFEIAATDKGIVFLLGQDFAPAAAGPGNLGLVDLSRGLPEKAFVVPVPIQHYGQFLQLAPEQDAVFVAGNHRLTTCVAPPRPALQRAVCAEFQLRNVLSPGWMQISPDGRTILHDIGSILSVRR
jgi:hypothetical protein